MNRIYKVIWNRTLGRSVVGPEFMRSHGKEKSTVAARAGLAAAVAVSWFGGTFPALAEVTAWESKHAGTITHNGDTYDINNQEMNGTSALNKFDKFNVGQKEVANLHLGSAERQINIVNQKMNVDGVVNALQNNKIGGDVYFFSNNGIAIGKTGVINVGRLTLGTNASYGLDLYNGGFKKYNAMTPAARAEAVAGDGPITMEGTIYAQGDVVLGTKKDLTVNGSIYAGLGTAGADKGTTGSADDIRSALVNLKGVTSATKAAALGNGDVALYTEDTLTVAGSAAEKANVKTLGGSISMTSSSHDAKLQADPTAVPKDGMISITDAYVDTSASDRDSGDVEITAMRDVMGVARVDVDDTTIDAAGKNGHQAGQVMVHVDANTKLYTWDIGDGAYAQIYMGKKGTGRNTISGDSIDIAATATTTGVAGDTGGKTEAQIAAQEQAAADSNKVLDLIKSKGGELRAFAQVTKTAAGAEVDIEKTDMKALSGTKGKKEHGQISIRSQAYNEISPTLTLAVAGYGVNVGLSDLWSRVHVDDSRLYAAKNIDMDAKGDNRVSMSFIELNLLDKYLRSTVNFSWAEVASDVSAKVGNKAVLTSGGDTSLHASSERQLYSSVTNGGDTNVIGLAVSVGLADTKATAEMAGTVYAGGDVKVSAENLPIKSGGVWVADDSIATALSGMSMLKETVDPISGAVGSAGHAVKDNAVAIFNRIKQALSKKAPEEIEMREMAMEEAPEPGQEENVAQKKPWNKLGLNGATALVVSQNTSEAAVTGKVRGVEDKSGTYVGSDDKGAKSLSVTAHTLSRSMANAGASQTDPAEETGADQKAVTVSAAVSYMGQKNSSTAYISGDVKTTGDVTVNAVTEMPWATKWASTDPTDQLINAVFTAISGESEPASYLVDSWTQSSGGGKTASGAASISVVNYDNSATAFIGKKEESGAAPVVEAGGHVNVEADTDITTVNFTGTVPNLVNKAPINLWKKAFRSPSTISFLNKSGWNGDEAAKAGMGGAALAVRQKNSTKAYIDDGATVKAKDAAISANSQVFNLAFSAAGGQAKSMALDATVGVGLVDNATKAYVGNATVKTEDALSLTAADHLAHVNLSGAGAVSQGAAAVGASVGYNHVKRDTEAFIRGTVEAGGVVSGSAKNTGDLISASVAGAVTYEHTNRVDNLAGSRGFYVDEEGHVEMEMQELVGEMADEEVDLNEMANEAIEGAVEAEPAMEDNAGQAKNGLAIAANVAVNRINDSAKAYVAKGSGGSAPKITAKSLTLDASNASAIYSTSGAISANMPALNRQNNLSIAGSFMYNTIGNTNEAYVDGAELTLSGRQEKDESLTVKAENKERILNIAGSGSGAASDSARNLAAAGQISLNQVKNQTRAYVKDSTVEAGKAASVSAVDVADIDSYTGAVAASLGGNGHAVGASIGVNLLDGTTSAYMEDTKVTGLSGVKGGSVTVSAEDKKDLFAILASGGGAKGFAGSFTGTGNWISSNTDAHISTAKGMQTGALSIDASNHSNSTLGVGNLAVGKNAAGASIGVMVNESTVNASLTGDADRKQAISADSISVKADNVYNGSASDSESDSTAKNVAVGFAGGTSKFAGSGSVTVNVIKQTTDALLGKGLYEAGKGAVDVTAHTKANLFGFAGGLSVSQGGGLGAAVDVQHYTGHTYAGLADGAHLSRASAVNVAAASEEHLTSVGVTLAGGFKGFGGAGAAGSHSISTDTKAYVGNDKDTETTDAAALTDAGAVSVTASDTTKLGTGAGVAGAGKEVGGGLTAAVEVVKKQVNAYVGNHTNISGTSLTVKAENQSEAETGTAGLAAGGSAGVAGSFSETFVNHATHAYVGKNASIAVTGGADVNADSSFTQKSWAGGAGFGLKGAGVGIVNATAKLDADTKAYVDDNVNVVGGSHVNIGAAHDTHLTYATVAGGAGGYVGVDGAVGVNVLSTETKAYAGEGVSLSAAQAAEQTDSGISLSAKDTTWLDGGNGGLAVGVAGAGVGAAVAVNSVKKDTEAYVGRNASLDTAGTTTISAANTEEMRNITLQGAGGTYTGIAGAVNVNVLDVTTKAFTGSGVKLNQTQGKNSGAVTVGASHEIKKLDNTAVGAAGGIVGVGAAVDVGVVRTQTNAYLGDNNQVSSGGAVSVTATDNMHDISTQPWAGGIGAVGLSGSVSVYSFGSQLSKEDTQSLSGKNENGEDVSLDDWVTEEINSNAQLQVAMDAYKTNALDEVKDSIAAKYDVKAPDTTGEKGTLAKVGQGTKIDAAGGVTVEAEDTLKVNPILGNLSIGAGAVGSTVSVVHTDTDTQALVGDGASIHSGGDFTVNASSLHHLDSAIMGASVAGLVAGQGTVGVWVDRADVAAMAGDVQDITAQNVSVTSSNTHTMDGAVVGASVAIIGLNGAVQTASISGTSTAALGSETGTRKGKVTAANGVTVSAKAVTDLKATAMGAGAGIFGATGTGTSLSSGVAAKASIGKGVEVTGKAISITASNTPKLYAHANGLALGGAAVGVSVAETKSTDSAVVTVADEAKLDASGGLTLSANVAPKDDVTMDTSAIAGSGGIMGNVSAAVSGAVVKQTAAVDVGQNASLKGNTISITAKRKDSGHAVMDSAGASMYSGTGGNVKYEVASDASVHVGDGTSLTSTGKTDILADNTTVKNEKQDNTAVSAGASVAGANGAVNETTITHTTKVDLGKVSLSAGASLTEADKAAGTTLYDKQAIAIDAASHITAADKSALSTGAAVGAAHVNNKTNVTADTSVTVAKGATLTAGDVDTVKNQVEDKDVLFDAAGDHRSTYRGGSIGIGTKNDADLYGSTLVDVFGAAGYAGSSNDVTYTGTAKTTFGGTAETAKGDIRTAAGRDSSGQAGQIHVSSHSDVLNVTVIPISSMSGPTSTVTSTADLAVGGSLSSDRDVYLQSNAGGLSLSASGAVKDWFNAIAGGGSDGYSVGKTQKTANAVASIDGTVETGIHRNRSVRFWGEPEKDKAGNLTGKWKLYADRDGTISYTVSGSVPVGTDLYKRYEELKNIQGDDAAMAAYNAEKLFLEQKMVDQGVGYYMKRGDKQEFVYTPGKTKSEYEERKADLEKYNGMLPAATAAYQKKQTELAARSTELTELQQAYETWTKVEVEHKEEAAQVYQEKVTAYNTSYQTTIDEDITKVSADDLLQEAKNIEKSQKAYTDAATSIQKSLAQMQGQIDATDDFFRKGGKEDPATGKFTLNGKDYNGTYTGEDGYTADYDYNGTKYFLLHKALYNQMTHDIQQHDVEATLGDIHLEGDTVYGSGKLSAPGNGTVSITNETPYNLHVNDVIVAGAGGTIGAGTGGRIILNDVAITGADAIRAKNKDQAKSVSFQLETRDKTDGPAVTVKNDFVPGNHKNTGDTESVFAAPSLHLDGLIYNPRGSVKADSAKGDVYTRGSINGGTVSVTAQSGDYIQSYNPNYRVFSAGGSPLDDKGKLNDNIGSGILANGNIFISARYVNINSTIQSGQNEFTYKIPENFQLYYKEGDNQVTIPEAEARKDATRTYYVKDADERLTYDAANDRFVLSGVEVRGGHVSIVGTIINTSKEGKEVGKIRALDGYGTISVTNDSTKTLELRNLDTGEGVEGTISITDLDAKSGKALQTTVYTYRPGYGVYQSVNGGTAEKVSPDYRTVYKPQEGLYYNLQTGTDSSETNRYELHRKGVVDWWGIEDKEPTKEDLLAMGGQLVAHDPGKEKPLNGGYYVSDKNFVGDRISSDGHYTTSEHNYATKQSDEVWDIQSHRPWYYMGLAKDWDVTLTETTYNTKIKQSSVKADYPVGIEFIGNPEGTLTVTGKGDIAITGTLSNQAGKTSLSGANITQTANGFISTKDLALTGTGDVGSTDQAIRTNAATLTGSAGSNFVVNDTGAVEVGHLTAGKRLALSAEEGISQKENTLAQAQRIELTAGSGNISGKQGAFQIQAGQGYGADYGLKASADGNISITNSGGDLYLDSVTAGGDAVLTTSGSFVDNNYTDVENTSATDKLKAWAEAAVLEHESTTISKQKKLLINRVMEKYNEYVNLSQHMVKGTYTLNEMEKAELAKNGTDVDAYAAKQQARYEELKGTVGTWTDKGVEAYIKEINGSTDATLYGNAKLTADQLTGDSYLTKEEKANALVGSAKSAQDLLITFTSGGIKEGITDTRTTQKQTPHVTGKTVTLTALGKDGASGSGNIGSKTTQTIDVSDTNIKNLTTDQLIALAAAERGDFQLNGNTATVTSIRPIEADSAGKVTAKAEHGALYLYSPGAFTAGSSFTAEKDLRLKTAGDLKDITVKSSGLTVLESGNGAISGVTLSGDGTLTARAKNGVELSKNGDLIINTLYASDGDVKVNLNGSSLYVENQDKPEEDYVHIEGKNITINDAANLEGIGANTPSVGMKLSDETGAITASVKDRADVTLLGSVKAEHNAISADTLTLRNRGTLQNGTYKGNMLTLMNSDVAEVSGGTFTGVNALTMENQGTVSGGTYTGQTVNLTNEKTMGGSRFTAEDALTYSGTADAELADSSLTSTKDSVTLQGGTFKNLSVKAAKTVQAEADKDASFETVSGENVTLTSDAGLTVEDAKADHGLTLEGNTLSAGTLKAGTDATLTSTGTLHVNSLTAGGQAVLSSTDGDVIVNTADVGSTDMTSGGAVTVDTLTSQTNATLSGVKDVKLNRLTTDGQAAISSQRGNVTVKTAQADQLDAKAGGSLQADTVHTNHAASLESGDTMQVGTLEAGTDANLHAGGRFTADSVKANGQASLTGETSLDVKTVSAGSDANLTSTGTLNVTKLTAGSHAALSSADGNITVNTADVGSTDMTSGGAVTVDKLTSQTNAVVSGVNDVILTTLTAADAASVSSSTGDVNVDTVKVGSADMKAGGALKADTVHTDQAATLASGEAMNVGTLEAGTDADLHAGGMLTADSIKANEQASLTGETSLDVKTISAGTDATVEAKTGDAKLDNISSGHSLLVKAEEDIILSGTAKADQVSVHLEAGKTLHAGTVVSGTDTTLQAANDLQVKDVAANGKLTANSGGSLSAETMSAGTDAQLDATGNMAISDVHAGGTLEAVSGNRMDLTSAEAGGTLQLHAGDTVNSKFLSSGADASLTSGKDLNVLDASIGKALSMNAGQNISIHRADSVSMDMTAGGSIVSDGALSSGDISMTAKDHIAVTTKTPVTKLQDVDTSTPAESLQGMGSQGSAFTADTRRRTYHPDEKGGAQLATSAGRVTLSAGLIELDTLHSDGAAQVQVAADHVGIDDVTGGVASFTITGYNADQARYVGLHSSTAPLRLADSRIGILDLSGADDVGLLRTSLSGSSQISTDYMTVSMRERGGSRRGEWIGHLILNRYNVNTDKRFVDVSGGITINGEHAVTGESTAQARLFGDRYLGRQGREMAEDYLIDTYRAIGFAPAAEEEDYAAVMK